MEQNETMISSDDAKMSEKWEELLDFATQHATKHGMQTGIRWLQRSFNEYLAMSDETPGYGMGGQPGSQFNRQVLAGKIVQELTRGYDNPRRIEGITAAVVDTLRNGLTVPYQRSDGRQGEFTEKDIQTIEAEFPKYHTADNTGNVIGAFAKQHYAHECWVLFKGNDFIFLAADEVMGKYLLDEEQTARLKESLDWVVNQPEHRSRGLR